MPYSIFLLVFFIACSQQKRELRFSSVKDIELASFNAKAMNDWDIRVGEPFKNHDTAMCYFTNDRYAIYFRIDSSYQAYNRSLSFLYREDQSIGEITKEDIRINFLGHDFRTFIQHVNWSKKFNASLKSPNLHSIISINTKNFGDELTVEKVKSVLRELEEMIILKGERSHD